jgi:hypothetical protein
VTAQDTGHSGRMLHLEQPFAAPPDPPGPGVPWLFARIHDVERHEGWKPSRSAGHAHSTPNTGPGRTSTRSSTWPTGGLAGGRAVTAGNSPNLLIEAATYLDGKLITDPTRLWR